MTTIFGKIIRKEIKADIVYESDSIIAFKDINPRAPVHILIVPKKNYPNLQSVPKEELQIIADVASVAQDLAEKFGVADGYRFVTNSGTLGGQEVFHLHFHLLGGRQMRALG